MSVVLECTEVKLERKDLLARSPIARPVSERGRLVERSRTPGIHLSGILYYIVLTSGKMALAKAIEEEELPLRMALGMAWEEFAASLYPEMHWQPGEVIIDQIAMTCDGLTPVSVKRGRLIGYEHHLEEFKFTAKKVRTPEELLKEEWYWMHQGRGYCWGYDTNIVRWHICYFNGYYNGEGPVYMRYLVEFSKEEIDTTRNMLVLNRDRAQEKGYGE